MSLNVSLTATRPTEVHEANITHNLAPMAHQAGLYECLWRPDELGITTANELIQPLTVGLTALLSDRAYFELFNPKSGYGDYDELVRFVTDYLEACKANPDAYVGIDR